MSIATPDELAQAAKDITHGTVDFGVAESEHVRIVHDLSSVSPEHARELLTRSGNAREQ